MRRDRYLYSEQERRQWREVEDKQSKKRRSKRKLQKQSRKRNRK